MIKLIVFELPNFIKIIIVFFVRLIRDHEECNSFYHLLNQRWQILIILHIVDIQKKYCVIVSYENAYFAHEIILNEFHDDFDKSYINIILFLRELKSHNYVTHV